MFNELLTSSFVLLEKPFFIVYKNKFFNFISSFIVSFPIILPNNTNIKFFLRYSPSLLKQSSRIY